MIARLFVMLPFPVAVPDGGQFLIREYIDEDYQIRIFPPGRSNAPHQDTTSYPDSVQINGQPAFIADVLKIEFERESFRRRISDPIDPAEEIMERAINSFLVRYRHVTRNVQVRPAKFPLGRWRIQYLHDDGSKLAADPGLVTGFSGVPFAISASALTNDIWEDLHALSPDYEPPMWETLLFDARAELPKVGPAIVLAAAALEVFASHVLDRLSGQSSLPPAAWQWINKRSDPSREPTVEERFDPLLKLFTGHSLKEDSRLWEAFRNLKTARNSFLHEGRGMVGGGPVDARLAERLISSASKIIATVRGWIPEELQWPEYKHSTKLSFTKDVTPY